VHLGRKIAQQPMTKKSISFDQIKQIVRYMKIKNIFTIILLILLLITIPKSVFSQIPDFSKVPSLDDGDSLNITYLINHGVKISNDKVICWFPKDSLSEKSMNEIIEMITIGIKGAEKLMNSPLSWQTHSYNTPYTIYFRFDKFTSHGSNSGFVSIPFWRIKKGEAPWLHEILHEMLYSKSQHKYFENTQKDSLVEKYFYTKYPIWIYEGLPEYMSLKVSIMENIPRFDPLLKGFQTNVDSLFLSELNGEKGQYILPFIGAGGVMPQLFSKDRPLYAPTFYHGSCSFIKYISDNYGLEILLNSISSYRQEQEVIENLTGKSLEEMKSDWLKKIKTKSN
jgi:hypothetical protein